MPRWRRTVSPTKRPRPEASWSGGGSRIGLLFRLSSWEVPGPTDPGVGSHLIPSGSSATSTTCSLDLESTTAAITTATQTVSTGRVERTSPPRNTS